MRQYFNKQGLFKLRAGFAEQTVSWLFYPSALGVSLFKGKPLCEMVKKIRPLDI